MKRDKPTAILATATALSLLCYAGSGFWGNGQAIQVEVPTTEAAMLPQILPTDSRETTLPEPETVAAPEADVAALLEQTMEGMDGHVFVYDVAGREMLCANTAEDEKLYPASITKLYTAWLALQYLPPETLVTAGEEVGMVGSGSSLAYISRECRLTVEMLVEAMLLPSGNDAAYVLAAAAGRAMAGDETLSATAAVQRFVAEMNREGERLGFVNSHFANPDGYHTGAHYSCPGDIALIGRLAMANETILRYTALEADSVTFASGEKITWFNTNRLVRKSCDQYCPDAVGLKTGYTSQSGYCLLAAFTRDDLQILVGIFAAEKNLPRYENAVALWACWE